MMQRTKKTWVLIGLALAWLALAGAVRGQEAFQTQWSTAVQHAEFSMGADDHAIAVRHLGHVLNCIAGEGGEGFDGSWGHPCGNQGAGLLNDIAEHPSADDLVVVLRAAHALAMAGVEEGSVASVQAAAAGVRALLLVIEERGG